MCYRLTPLLLAVYFLAGCADSGNKAAQQPPEIPVMEVIEEDVPVKTDFIGETYGLYDIPIRARVEGMVTGIHFEEGSRVNQGALLYSIDPDPFLANTSRYESNLAQAKTALVKAKSDLDRIEPLAEINAVSKSDLDAARAAYDAAQAAVKAAEAQLEAANIELGYTRIYAPIRGIIGRTQAKVGDFVGREPNPVVLNAISRIDTILVRFSITERQYLNMMRYEDVRKILETNDISAQSGDNLELILADGSIHPYPGRVNFIDRNINPSTGTLLLQASFPNPEGVLRPGLFARVQVKVRDLKDATLVPQRSISEIQGTYQLYVVNDSSKVEQRKVEVGPRTGNLWVVLEGVTAGEKVVVEGLQQVRPGMMVQPVPAEFEIIE